jgi:DNA-binding CsgD family transcriptional regulator
MPRRRSGTRVNFQDKFARLGIADFRQVRAYDADGTGVAFIAPSPCKNLCIPVAGCRWNAWRPTSPLPSASGVACRQAIALSPRSSMLDQGRVVHAEAEASASAARRDLQAGIDRLRVARGQLRREAPEKALALWRGFVSGQWSLVESVYTDNRRYVMARRNEPLAPRVLQVTPAEGRVLAVLAVGHSPKLVSYELGVSHSSVSTLTAAGLRKLGLQSRAELMRLLSGPRSFQSDAGGGDVGDCRERRLPVC